MTFEEINDTTGFAYGVEFKNDAEVRAYFSDAAYINDLRRESYVIYTNEELDELGMPPYAALTSDELHAMAETVIENRWHYADSK